MKFCSRSRRALALALGLISTSAVLPASASATVHYQTGFESPSFTLGQLIGQDGWVGDPAANPAIAVQNTVFASGSQAVRANVPLGEMFGYATELRSATQGRGVFSMEFDHYAPVAQSVAQELLK